MIRVKAIRVSPPILMSATAGLTPAERNETAVPSYCHLNPLIRRLFWRRLDVAVGLSGLRAGESVLDFGTGSGLLLPTLHATAARVAATDIVIAPARSLAAAIGVEAELFPSDQFADWVQQHRSMFDCVFALDVLEHVEDAELLTLSSLFRRLLNERGRLIVSGPTESALYRLGRALAGFRNEYHHRNIFDISRVLEQEWAPQAAVFVPRRPLPRAFLVSRYVIPRGSLSQPTPRA